MYRLSQDEMIATYLELVMEYEVDWPCESFDSEEVYCMHPSTHFNAQDYSKLQQGGFLFVHRPVWENAGKTDGCEDGCWRTICSDKLIKSKLNGKVLGLKRILKFVPKKKPELWSEKDKRGTGDQRKWVIEEYRRKSMWNQDYVICKIRFMQPKQLGFLICDHMQDYF